MGTVRWPGWEWPFDVVGVAPSYFCCSSSFDFGSPSFFSVAALWTSLLETGFPKLLKVSIVWSRSKKHFKNNNRSLNRLENSAMGFMFRRKKRCLWVVNVLILTADKVLMKLVTRNSFYVLWSNGPGRGGGGALKLECSQTASSTSSCKRSTTFHATAWFGCSNKF